MTRDCGRTGTGRTRFRAKKANAFGLYDTLGNVWEWCSDRYDPLFYARSPSRDPGGAEQGDIKVFRGGSCLNFPQNVRVSRRHAGILDTGEKGATTLASGACCRIEELSIFEDRRAGFRASILPRQSMREILKPSTELAAHFCAWKRRVRVPGAGNARASIRRGRPGNHPAGRVDGPATEHMAHHTSEGIGGLLNATFGNAAELIIALMALREGLFDVVKASLTGSIIGNVLLVMGGAFAAGGLRYKTQTFHEGGARIQSTMMTLATIALILPAAFHHLAARRRRRKNAASASRSPS